jgi:hypothetical protein
MGAKGFIGVYDGEVGHNPHRRIYKEYHPYRVGFGWEEITYAKQKG